MELVRVLIALGLLVSVMMQAGASNPEKKAMKKAAKAQKKKEKHAKHLLKDEERTREGVPTQHHEIRQQVPSQTPGPQMPWMPGPQMPPGYLPPDTSMSQGNVPDYNTCVQYVHQKIAQKEAEQRKHAMKDQERAAKGEMPEHTGEASMTKDYQNDPKFDIVKVCGASPQASVTQTTGTGATGTVTTGTGATGAGANGNGATGAGATGIALSAIQSMPVWMVFLWSGTSLLFAIFLVTSGHRRPRGPAEEPLLAA